VLYDEDVVFTTVRAERGYKNRDIITVSPEKLPGYEDKIKMFFDEHLHDDEEIRFCLEGSGYFDVRDEESLKWIRVEVVPGDMIVLPVGIYHRFTCDENNFIKAMRLFQEEPMWTAFSRTKPETDLRPARASYLSYYTKLNSAARGGPEFKSLVLGDRAKALANYPHAKIVGDTVYVSGTSSRRPDNTHAGASLLSDGTWELDIRAQTQAVLENISWILQRAGSDLSHVASMTVFLIDFKDYEGFNEVFNLYFDPENGPARTTVAVARLPHQNLLIEIQAVAYLVRDE